MTYNIKIDNSNTSVYDWQNSNIYTTTTIPTSIYSGSDSTIGLPPNDISIRSGNKEIVKITSSGEVIWADGIKMDEAAKAFSDSIYVGLEMKSGITEATKSRVRNAVFEELIEIADEQGGSISSEDLKYFLKANIMVDKIKRI